MPLTLVTGPPNSGKTGRAYARLREALANHAACVLLLPSLPDVDRASKEFAAIGPVGLKVVQFDRYLAARWGTHGDGRSIVSEVQREALVRSALEAQGGSIRAHADARGMVALVARLARDSAASAPPGPSPRGHSGDLVAVVGRYREMLQERGLVEPQEAFAVLSSVVADEHDVLVAHRFSDFAQHQLAYLRAVASSGKEVLVTLTWQSDCPATAVLTPVVQRMLEEGARHETVGDSYGSSPELVLLAHELFRTRSAPLPAPADIGVWLCGQLEDEIELAAREAATFVSEGTEPEDVAIVYRDPWTKARAVRRALADRGLECDLDIEQPLFALPLGRAATLLLRFAAEGARHDLLAWLRSPFSGVGSDDVAGLERRWRGRREQNAALLSRDVREASIPAARAIGIAAEMASAVVDEAWANRFDDLVAHLISVAHGGADGRASDMEDDSRAAARMAAIVGDASQATPVVRAQDIVSVLLRAQVGPGRTERRGRVQVTSVERIRARRFAAVILGGLTADEFPITGSEDPRRAGAVGDAAKALGLTPDDDRDAREQADFFSVVTRPRKRLVLLTHEMSSDGEPLAPSPFWSEVVSLYASGETAVEPPSFVQRYAGTDGRRSGGWRTLGERLRECAEVDDGASSAGHVYSPNELEAYIACPAKWFRERLLRPESPDACFSHLESGSLVHEVLRDTLAGVLREGHSRITPKTLSLAEAIARDSFERAMRRYTPMDGLAETDAQERARRSIAAFLVAEAAFAPRLTPAHLEYAFGYGEAGGEPVDVGGLLLRGRIDRIDDADGGVLVTDYKTGRISPFASFDKLGLLQLQLYAAALKAQGQPVAGAVYRSLRDGKLSGFHLEGAFCPEELPGSTPLDAEAFEATLARAVTRARDAAAGIRGCLFEPSPNSPNTCRTCTLSPTCKEAS